MHFSTAAFASVLAASSVQGLAINATSFSPSAIWNYSVNNGAISETTTGEIFKATNNNGRDITTLVTFTYPAAAQGRQCRFAFFLDQNSVLSGSGKLDLYTTNSPAPGPRTGWGPGNQRNNHLGRLSAVKGGDATWDATYSTYLTQMTPCSAPGTVESFELVGVYDNDRISWYDPDTGPIVGPRIIFI